MDDAGILLGQWWRGFFLFLFFFIVHVLVWRRRRPRRTFYALLIIFYGIPSVAYGIGLSLEWVALEGLPPFVLHLFLAANYIAAYPAIEAKSPTVDLLYEIHRSPNGLDLRQCLQINTQPSVVQDRLEDLRASGFTEEKNGNLVLNQKGRLLADVFTWYRKFIGESVGGG